MLYNVLIIDDHPIISDAYTSAFEYISAIDSKIAFNITVVSTSDDAIQQIKKAIEPSATTIDLVFLDISIPPSTDGTILTGEDLGVQIRQLLPKTRIIIATTYNDNYRIQCFLQRVNPDGLLIKNDINKEELIIAIKAVLSNPPYYSKTVLKVMQKLISSDYSLDKIDRQLLYELSNGAKMNELPAIIPMSLNGLEKRKRKLKEIFDIPDKDDRLLIQIARTKGFI
ncbi:MAG: response regulator [Flavobacteriaceae bacterium]|nr:response regulator [Flavobacteriaceae bacterium]